MARSEIEVAAPGIGSDAIITGKLIASDASGASGYKICDTTVDERVGLVITNKGATGLIRLKASDVFTALGQGDTTHIVGGGTALAPGSSVITIEGARVRQSDGDIYVDSGVDGTAYCVQLN